MIVRGWAVRTLLLCVIASPGGGQQPAAAPTYQPGIDILDYDITIELPDTGKFIRADVTMTLRRVRGVSRLRLDLIDSLAVRRVEVDGRVVTSTHANGKIDIPLAGARDSLGVRVVYDGIVNDGLVVRTDSRGRWTWFADNWPDRARQWLATVDHPSDKATVSWRVIAPEGRTVVANGELVGGRRVTVRGAPMQETRWRESRPVPTYVMVIAAGPLEKYDLPASDCQRGQCVRQSVYTLPENQSWLPGPFAAAGPIVSLFERLVGPFPYEKLAHLQSSTRFGGMENASAIFYDDKLIANHRLDEGTIAHETAHQWFGDAVTEREWGHLWLSEGFATYFAALWTRHNRGEAAYHADLARMRTQILGDSVVFTRPVIDSTQTNYLALLNTNSYQKGGYILYMLHDQLGDSAFFGALRSYYVTYRNGTALSDDLRVELERTSKRSLKPFFDQWLRRPGVAEPSVGWTYDAARQTVSLVVLQPAGHEYDMSLPVMITDATGASTRVLVDIPAQPRATIALTGSWPVQPRALVFDPDERLLARISRL